MEEILRQALLYDFYGELLTAHQRQIYEDVVFHDLSLSEIAQSNGISRQGVHDLLKRCDKILTDYENKLHLVKKFVYVRQRAAQIKALSAGEGCEDGQTMSRIGRLAEEILEEL